ncbi:thiamine biosynthesis protein ApbE [Paenibacillus sp. 79R4]|uniref:FAD:protein FMN transferase n=1 Tax=Paenibacillus sp. 79R4 TaxID=2212847 RepID=UPI0015BE669F|nr:FAD:protein FMN transferase [Paenibacillus sp. 79R4]NWL89927.1 thiamine biosynthesis protein ApbE [Paenibacillus sp. 79R4]
MMRRKWIAGTLVILFIVAIGTAVFARGSLSFLSGFGQESKTESKETAFYSQTYFIFDTVVNVKLYGEHAKPSQLEYIKDLMEDMDQKLSRTLETSEIYRVNQAAGKQAVRVSQDTFDVVQTALDYAIDTGGLYDPTVGPLISLWNIGNEGAHIPSEPELNKAVHLIGYKDVEINSKERTIKLLRPGMALDLGGIGKEYTANRIAAYLNSQQVDSAIINLGGSSIIALGSKPDGQSWNIGLQDPDKARGEVLGRVLIKNKTIDSSGVYERFFIENGVRYHHIMDPRTGYPSRSGLKSVTIICDSMSNNAPSSTAVFIMGLEEGMKVIKQHLGVEALFITEDNQIYMTPGLKEQIRFTNPNYTVKTID